ncbi:segregation and condensation protein A [Alicyclobacillus contaminans]|uniref:segregation and condensation protein A n=1 Tax=Alicyclobacillus contaminans TaxID=392016 RepID=UPI00041F78EE|nr:segregation/condensation protein A [Alicyclobacillus contaminans]GMA52472.1 segregation and condensation protein A [Alicyclobacillus contaminans]
MAYDIVLDQFSGPLDLLLHLIQKHEVDIFDIPIAKITDQYLAYLRAMEELSLEIASEFLVMAATLLAIKSRMLLPRPAKSGDDEDEDSGDPRDELVQQLVEYQRAKWAAAQLRERGVLQSQVFSRPPLDLRPYAPEAPPPVTGVTLWDLVDAFRKLMRRIPQEERVAEIQGVVLSVDDEMDKLMRRMRILQRTTFFQLVQDARTRHALVTAFLAVLELMKAGRIACRQLLAFGDIEIVLTEEAAEG